MDKETRKKIAKAKKKSNNIYIDKKELYDEVIKCKQNNNIISEKLSKMFILLVEKISKSKNFSGYTYLEDMKSEALLNLCESWHKFNEEKSKDAFSYYTTVVTNRFLQQLNKEKKHRTIRDEILLEHGYNPSFSYQNEHSEEFLKLDNLEYEHSHSNNKNDNHLDEPKDEVEL